VSGAVEKPVGAGESLFGQQSLREESGQNMPEEDVKYSVGTNHRATATVGCWGGLTGDHHGGSAVGMRLGIVPRGWRSPWADSASLKLAEMFWKTAAGWQGPGAAPGEGAAHVPPAPPTPAVGIAPSPFLYRKCE